MRRFVRDKLIELTETLKEVKALGLIDDCKEGLGAVKAALQNSLSISHFAVYENFDIEHLDELSDKLKAETEIEIEIVFMPYKAAMWDALESVYFAAKADKRCHAEVVPVPYYEIENGHKVLHYEGDNFPPDIPITHFGQYNMELIRPDIGYLHNVYDGNNRITRVDDFFHTRNLKQFIKKLVYIPYYVSDATPTESFTNAIVASKIDILVSASEENVTSYRAHGVKCEIAALGSPKIDKIINREKNKPALPDDWANLKGKKIFFLNTSISGLLKSPADVLKKLKEYFKIFEGRTDIALLWRPHPLFFSTFESMAPSFIKAAKELKNTVEASDWGIIDQTGDMGVAIAVSDAYIGDSLSSLVYLYALTGKPMMRMNFKYPISPAPEDLDSLLKSEILETINVGNETYAVSEYNAIYKMNGRKAEFFSKFPTDTFYNPCKPFRESVHIPFPSAGASETAGKKLIFCPIYGYEFFELDTETKQWRTETVSEICRRKETFTYTFCGVIDTPEALIFAPGESGVFARYDKNTGKYSYHTEWFEAFKKHLKLKNVLKTRGCTIKDGKIWLTCSESSYLTELDPNTMEFTLHKAGPDGYGYYGITHLGGSLWLTKFRLKPDNHEEGLVEYNPSTGKFTEYVDLPAKIPAGEKYRFSGFSHVITYKDSLYMFPIQADGIVKLNPKTGENKRFELTPPLKFFTAENDYFKGRYELQEFPFNLRIKGSEVITVTPFNMGQICINLDTGEWERFSYETERPFDILTVKLTQPVPVPWTESFYLTPERFINEVLSGEIAYNQAQADLYRNINANSDGTCGEKVHEYLMEKFYE
ncbi:MAG: hypothetical protein LBM87_07420 [Ruminococcus sp.]|jgi:hypothetical protein|nr:hypothetical protein [Ruminococcus sp.]